MRHIRLFSGAMLALIVLLAATPFATGPAKAAGSGCLPGILKQRLSQIRSKFGAVSILSAHRRGARIAGTGRVSYHASCRAVDFTAPRGKYAQVVAWLKQNHGGGVGTYSCGMHHIHIDNGPHVRYHHCVSSSGRPTSRYAKRRGSRRTQVARQSSRPSRNRARTAQRRTVQPTAKTFSALGHFASSKINGG